MSSCPSCCLESVSGAPAPERYCDVNQHRAVCFETHRPGETGLSDLHWLGIWNSDFSFYKGYPCHTYLDMEKHLVCLAFTCMV